MEFIYLGKNGSNSDLANILTIAVKWLKNGSQEFCSVYNRLSHSEGHSNSFILGLLIAVGQPSVGDIDHETKPLLEKFRYVDSLSAFPNSCKPAVDPSENLNIVQVCHEQCQFGPSGQPIGSGFNALYFEFIFPTFLIGLLMESSIWPVWL